MAQDKSNNHMRLDLSGTQNTPMEPPQGLWVQEVRVAGRTNYKKVLGTKNPADSKP